MMRFKDFFQRYILESVDLDKTYLDAVERNDMMTARRLVDDAAKVTGYDIGPMWHGTDSKFNTFNKIPIFLDKSEKAADNYGPIHMCLFVKKGKRGYVDSDIEFRQLSFKANKVEALQSRGVDSIMNEDGRVAIFTPSNVKLADPVIYDDEGNIIPLSKRFDNSKDDIRY
jgi:hypothetical protein